MKYRPIVASGLSLFLMATTSQIGLAQTANPGTAPQAADNNADTLEEVVVTAQRRDQNIQRTPVSVTAFNAFEIQQRGIQSTIDIGANMPGVTTVTSTGTVGAGDYTIRGIGQDSVSIGLDPGVGLYIDDVYIARTSFSSRALFDLDRVEVLRGPQGTLYGRNSSGGAVKLYTKQPTDEFGGQFEAFYGNYDRYEVLAAINVPVAPDLSLRVSGSRSGEERGYFYNSTLGHRVGTSDNDYLHGVLRYDPGSKLQITLSADYNRLDSDGAYLVNPFDEPYETAAGLYAARLPFNKDTLNTTQTPLKLYDNSIEYGVSLNAKYDLTDEIYVRSITAYRHNSVTPELDINNEGVALDVDTSGSQVTEELQIGGKAFDDKLDFIGGVYYFHEDSHQNWIVAIPLADFYIQNTYAAILTDSEAAYAQATYSVMPWLRLTAGARYSHDEKTLGVNSTLGAAYNTATLIANGIPTSISANKLTPKFGIEADLADDVLGYFTYTKGFKGGGFNATSGNFRDDVPFAPESVEAYELGLKTQWFGNRLRVNTALFENNLSNAQFDFLVPGTGDIDQGNVASATIKGVELESSAVLSSGWTAFGYVDYTYNVIDSVSPLALEAAIRPGNQLKDTPKWKYQIGTAYSTPLNFIPGAVTFRGTWTWTGKSFNLPTDDPTEVVPSHGKFDIRIRYESENGDWYAQLEGDNITNDRYQIARLTVLPTVPAQANLPAQFGVRFGANF